MRSKTPLVIGTRTPTLRGMKTHFEALWAWITSGLMGSAILACSRARPAGSTMMMAATAATAMAIATMTTATMAATAGVAEVAMAEVAMAAMEVEEGAGGRGKERLRWQRLDRRIRERCGPR